MKEFYRSIRMKHTTVVFLASLLLLPIITKGQEKKLPDVKYAVWIGMDVYNGIHNGSELLKAAIFKPINQSDLMLKSERGINLKFTRILKLSNTEFPLSIRSGFSWFEGQNPINFHSIPLIFGVEPYVIKPFGIDAVIGGRYFFKNMNQEYSNKMKLEFGGGISYGIWIKNFPIWIRASYRQIADQKFIFYDFNFPIYMK